MDQPFEVSVEIREDIPATAVDLVALKDGLGSDFEVRLATQSQNAPEQRDLSQLAPIVVDIRVVLGVAGVVAGAKIVELFSEDLYRSVKSMIRSIFHGRPDLRREVRITFRDHEPLVIASVAANSAQVIERALSSELTQLKTQILDIVANDRMPDTVSYIESTSGEEVKVNVGDPIPPGTRWILVQYDDRSHKWRVASVLANGRVYLRSR